MEKNCLSLQSYKHSQRPATTIVELGNCFEVKNIVIGYGAFGQIYLCWNEEEKQIYAAKMKDKNKVMQNLKIGSFSAERKAKVSNLLKKIPILLKSIDHYNIAKFQTYFEIESALIYITEYCNEGTLADLIRKQGKLDYVIAIPIIKQIINAVKYLHQKDICHRGLRLTSILFKDGVVKLSHCESAISIKDSDSETGIILTKDSGEFVAPETYTSQNINLNSDIWSLGVIFFHMLYGCSPWPTQAKTTNWHKRLLTMLKFPEDVFVPHWLTLLIQKMLIYEVELRPNIREISNRMKST